MRTRERGPPSASAEITYIAVPKLRRHEVGHNVEGSLHGADIIMSPTNPGKVTVSYSPNVKKLQHKLKSGKHPLQVRLKTDNCFSLINYFSLFLSMKLTDHKLAEKSSYWRDTLYTS